MPRFVSEAGTRVAISLIVKRGAWELPPLQPELLQSETKTSEIPSNPQATSTGYHVGSGSERQLRSTPNKPKKEKEATFTVKFAEAKIAKLSYTRLENRGSAKRPAPKQ